MEHPAGAEPCHRYRARLCLSRALVCARFRESLAQLRPERGGICAEADRVSWAAHVEEFRRVRLSTISLFRNVPSQAWARSGIASDNHFTVRALAYIIPGHFAHHVSVLRERYL